jgi:hypothetical protein
LPERWRRADAGYDRVEHAAQDSGIVHMKCAPELVPSSTPSGWDCGEVECDRAFIYLRVSDEAIDAAHDHGALFVDQGALIASELPTCRQSFLEDESAGLIQQRAGYLADAVV